MSHLRLTKILQTKVSSFLLSLTHTRTHTHTHAHTRTHTHTHTHTHTNTHTHTQSSILFHLRRTTQPKWQMKKKRQKWTLKKIQFRFSPISIFFDFAREKRWGRGNENTHMGKFWAELQKNLIIHLILRQQIMIFVSEFGYNKIYYTCTHILNTSWNIY
jgi:hypothetical protein